MQESLPGTVTVPNLVQARLRFKSQANSESPLKRTEELLSNIFSPF